VVFSSGFFGFFAHAGFLAGLRELGVAPSAYAGASSGAIVAAMAASGMPEADIQTLLFSLTRNAFWDPPPRYRIIRAALRGFRGTGGYLQGKAFANLLQALPVQDFESCTTPLVITATNLTGRTESAFHQGDLIPAICASGAVPILFQPVDINGSLYTDGGIVSKAPIRALADHVALDRILVHMVPSANLEDPPNGFLSRRWTPWRIQHLAVNIARQHAYALDVERLSQAGVETLEIRYDGPPAGPNRLENGREAYDRGRANALRLVSWLNGEA
jgi:NTE family protein